MNRKLAIFLSFILVLPLLFGTGGGFADVAKAEALVVDRHEWYVSAAGDDSNTGTIDTPLATLEEARERIRELKAGDGLPAGGITVYVRGGVYKLTETFELGEVDSGTAESPIVYTPYDGEQVSFIGGDTIDPAAFTLVQDAAVLSRIPEEAHGFVMQIDLQEQGVFDLGEYKRHGYLHNIDPAPLELFINHHAMNLARWPNLGTVPIGEVLDKGSVPREGDYSNRGGTFTYSYDRANRWTEAKQLLLHGYFAVGYAEDNIPVSEIDTSNKTIKLASSHLYGISGGNDWSSYYAYNLLEEIDMPGEYFVDYDTGMLYVYPSEPLQGAVVQVSMMEAPLIALEGASFVTLRGFTFENSRGMGIYMERGESNHIAGNTFRNLGTIAISIGQGVKGPDQIVHDFTGTPESRIIGNIQGHIYQNQDWNRLGGKNHVITGNNIYNTGAGGIFIGAGDRVSLTPANIQVINNKISQFNRRDKGYRPGIWVSGVGNRVAHNEIYDAPHMAIYLNGNDHIIEKNEIHDVVLEADDMGSIYMGRNVSEQGNVIRYNFFHHIGSPWEGQGTQAVFLDDGASGQQIYGNVFYQAGTNGNFKIHGGHHNVFENNISIEIPHAGVAALWSTDRWISYLNDGFQRNRLLSAINIKQPPYSTKYPVLSSYYNDALEAVALPSESNMFRNNVIVNGQLVTGGTAAQSNNYITNQNPGFVNASSMNFQLRSDSVVYDEIPSFQPIPFDEIGLYSDEYRTWTVESGSFNPYSPADQAQNVDPANLLFQWEPSEGISEYHLMVSEDPGFGELVLNVKTRMAMYDASHALSYDKTYYWKIEGNTQSISRPGRISNSNGAAAFSTVIIDAPPAAPLLRIDAGAINEARLLWDAVPLATSYKIYRGTQLDANFEEIAHVEKAVSFIDENASSIHDYYYYIVALNRIGESPVSTIIPVYGGTVVLFKDSFDGSVDPVWSEESHSYPGEWTLKEEGGSQVLNFTGQFGNMKWMEFKQDEYIIETKFRVNGWLGTAAANQMFFITTNDSGTSVAGQRYQFMYRNTGKLQLEKRAAGGLQAETDFQLQPELWYTLKLVVSGSHIQGYIDDVLMLDYTDSNLLKPGAIGIYAWNANIDFDEFQVHIPKWRSVADPWKLRSYGGNPSYGADELGRYTIKAAGADVWGSSDEFGYISQVIQDSQSEMITMDITMESLTNTDDNTMAGIMFRAKDTPDSSNFFLRMKPNGEIFTTVRTVDSGVTTYKNVPAVTFPTKLRVTRENQIFSSYFMKDGSWVKIHQVKMDMPNDILVGLAASSRKRGAYAEAVFSDVSLTRSPLVLHAPIIEDVTPRNGAISIAWSGSSDVSAYKILYGSAPGELDSEIALAENVSSYTLSGLINGRTHYFKIVAIKGLEESATEEYSAIPSADIVNRDAYMKIEGESYDQMHGIINQGTYIGGLDLNDWVRYNNVNFSDGATGFTARLAVPAAYAGKTIEIRLDRIEGPLLGTMTVASTGAFTVFEEQTVSITADVEGIHDVYLVFKGGSGVANLDYFYFQYETEGPQNPEPGTEQPGSPNHQVYVPEEHILILVNGVPTLRVNERKWLKDLSNMGTGTMVFELDEMDSNAATRAIQLPLSVWTTLLTYDKEIEIRNGEIRLRLAKDTIDSALLSGDVIITITSEAGSQSGHQAEGFAHVSGAYTVSIASEGKAVKFNQPFGVTFHVSDVRNSKLVAIYEFNKKSVQWEYVGGEYDSKLNSLQLEAAGPFSSYAALEYTRDFSDVSPDHWAKDIIDHLAMRGIMLGVGSNSFAPSEGVTRAMFVTLMNRLLGLADSAYEGQFMDVKGSDWYAGAIAAAYKAGLVQGNGIGMNPNGLITREEMAVMAMRAYEKLTYGNTELPEETNFSDDTQISSWARGAVGSASALGIMNGKPSNQFKPKSTATRAEAAAVVYRMLHR